MAHNSFFAAFIAGFLLAAASTASVAQTSTSAGATPVRPADTGLVISPPPKEWPEDKIDRLTKKAEKALSDGNMPDFYGARAELMGAIGEVLKGLYDSVTKTEAAFPLGQDSFGREKLAEWATYFSRVSAWLYMPRPPQQQSMAVPSGKPLPSFCMGEAARSNPACVTNGSVPASFPAMVSNVAYTKVAVDSQAYCTHGNAGGSPTGLTPTDGEGNPLPPNVMEIGDTRTSGGGRVPSAMNDPDAPKVQDGDDQANTMDGKAGRDDMSGRGGRDEYWFRHGRVQGDPENTLDDGDRIRDYESGEPIIITGVRLQGRNVTVKYDAEKDETRIELDLPDQTGAPDGKPDKTIILNGDKRGRLEIDTNCCGGEMTEIKLTTPRKRDGGQQQQQSQPTPPLPIPQSVPQRQATEQQSTPQSSTPQSSTPQSSTPQSPTTDGNVTIFFKATETVLKGQTPSTELQKQDLKLVARQEPPLPKTGTPKPAPNSAQDAGFDRSPVACRTDAKGECRAQIPADERKVYGIPDNGPNNYRADLNMSRNSGAVIENDPKQKQKTALPSNLANVATTSDFKIGDKSYTRVAIRGSDATVAAVLEKLKTALGPRVQIDICEEKKPGPPLGMEPVSWSAINNELPETTIRLRPLANR